MQKYYLGVDFGSTNLKIGMVTRDGRVFSPRRYPAKKSTRQETVATLENALSDYLNHWEGAAPEAIGLGLVGLLDIQNGIWAHSLNLNIQEPFPIVEHLSGIFQVPIHIDNDVHAATLAESVFGSGRITDHFILINIGTGIAAGIVCNGRLIRGVGNSAGEIGHMCVRHDGPLCSCGHRGCLETIAGGLALINRARSELPLHPESLLHRAQEEDRLYSSSIFDAAVRGDALARTIAGDAVSALGIGIVNMVNTLNPEHVVLTGSVSGHDWFFENVKDYVFKYAYITALRRLAGFSRSEVADGNLGICGAAALCWAHI